MAENAAGTGRPARLSRKQGNVPFPAADSQPPGLGGPGGGCSRSERRYLTAKIFLNSAPHFWISASGSSRIEMTLALLIPSIGG